MCIRDRVDMIPTSTTELTKSKLLVYPNPSNDSFQVTNLGDQKIDGLVLYNQLGQMVRQTSKDQMNISNLSNGIYFLEVMLEGERVLKKVMVSK